MWDRQRATMDFCNYETDRFYDILVKSRVVEQVHGQVQECLFKLADSHDRQKEVCDAAKDAQAHSDLVKHENVDLRERLQAF